MLDEIFNKVNMRLKKTKFYKYFIKEKDVMWLQKNNIRNKKSWLYNKL